jgi:hypothetical protein
VLAQTAEENFNRIVDTETKDDDCRSIQTIMTNVVGAGYGYADYIRAAFGIPSTRPAATVAATRAPVLHREAVEKIDAFLTYTAQTLEGKWEMTDEEIMATKMTVRWGPTYDLEQLLEHAIVHILRHRRQVERFLERMGG